MSKLLFSSGSQIVSKSITLLRDVDTNIFEKLTDAEKENLRGQLGRLSTVVERFDTMIEDGTSTDKAAPPETPKTVVTKVVSNTVEKPRFYIARRHADEPFIHCLTEGKTITNLGMSVEFEPVYIGQSQKTNVEYRAFFIDEANEIISDVKPIDVFTALLYHKKEHLAFQLIAFLLFCRHFRIHG